MTADDEDFTVTVTADPWEVIADTKEEAANLRLRSDLMIAIAEVIRTHEWSQADAADRIGITRPRMNDLIRGKIDKFSLDALVNIGIGLGLHVTITRTPIADFSLHG
ncbi:helix-turn-helix domain-containing protein [Mycolicibacter algericus]|uniref:helix-turn-helix domain-containing protein n=1 Tax=Mycolicibacter algericus TaxID=1288388 RepID=UPI003C752E77